MNSSYDAFLFYTIYIQSLLTVIPLTITVMNMSKIKFSTSEFFAGITIMGILVVLGYRFVESELVATSISFSILYLLLCIKKRMFLLNIFYLLVS